MTVVAYFQHPEMLGKLVSFGYLLEQCLLLFPSPVEVDVGDPLARSK